MRAGGAGNLDDVLLHLVVHVDLSHRLLRPDNLLRIDHLPDAVQRMLGLLLGEDVDLGGGIRVAQVDAEHEAVQLRLGQREGALVLDGVLGGDDQEGPADGVRKDSGKHDG